GAWWLSVASWMLAGAAVGAWVPWLAAGVGADGPDAALPPSAVVVEPVGVEPTAVVVLDPPPDEPQPAAIEPKSASAATSHSFAEVRASLPIILLLLGVWPAGRPPPSSAVVEPPDE